MAGPGTAVAPASPPQLIDRLLGDRQRMRAYLKEIRNKTWGKDVDENTAKGIISWAERRGIDAATELSVLGGNVYIEAEYYIRRLTGMIGAGQVEYAVPDHVHYDERLEKLAQDEKAPDDVRKRSHAEHYRRIEERAKHGLPDNARAACVFRVKLRNTETEFTGAKAVGGFRGKSESGKFKDPVGEEFPFETAETRAARRCLRWLIDTFPGLRAEMEMIEAEADLISVEIGKAKQLTSGRSGFASGNVRDPIDDLGGSADPDAGGRQVQDAGDHQQAQVIQAGGGQKITDQERRQLYATIEKKDIDSLTKLGDHAALHELLAKIRGTTPDQVHIVADGISLAEHQIMLEMIAALPPRQEIAE